MRNDARSLAMGAVCAVLVALSMFFGSSAMAGVGDPNVNADAAIQAFKLKTNYANDGAYATAKRAAYVASGRVYPGLTTADVYFNTTLNAWRYYTGAAWATSAPGAGLGQTLDQTYGASTPPTINRTVNGTLTVSDGTNDALGTMLLRRTAGTGNALTIANSGTGSDIYGTGGLFSVSKAGAVIASDLTMGSDQQVHLGPVAGVELEWDTAVVNGLLVAAAANTPINLCADAAGCDLRLFTTAAGDNVIWDASAKTLTFTDTSLLMGEDDPIKLGATGMWQISGQDAGALKFIGDTDKPIEVGVSGAGHDFTLFGDTAGNDLFWDQSAGALIVRGSGTIVQMKDGNLITFGDGAGVAGDMSLAYTGGATNKLKLLKTVAGPAGRVEIGQDDEGINWTFFGDTSGSKCAWENSDDQLVCTAADIQVGDGASVIFGSGVGVAGDFKIGNVGAANKLFIAQSNVGTGTIESGSDGDGIDWTFFTNTASSYIKFVAQAGDYLLFNAADAWFNDNAKIRFGTGGGGTPDMTVTYDGTYLVFDQSAPGAGHINYGVNDEGYSSTWYGDTAGASMMWLDNTNFLTFVGAAGVKMADSTTLNFGSGLDISAAYDGGTNILNVTQAVAGTGQIYVGTDGKGIDQTLYTETASSYVKLDQANDALLLHAADIKVDDHSAGKGGIRFGTGPGAAGDLYLSYDGGTNALSLVQNVSGTGTVEFGTDGDGVPTTFYFDAVGANVTTDKTNNRLAFNGAAGSWYADNAVMSWGNTAAAPDAKQSWDGSVLLLDTGGAANITYQMGTRAANHIVSMRFGDGTDNYTVSTSSRPVYTGGMRYSEVVFLPAGQFVPAGGTTALGNSDLGYGWNMINAATEAIQVYWQPPSYADTTEDVTGRVLFACSNTGDTAWSVNYDKIIPGTTLTADAGADVAFAGTCAVAKKHYVTNAFTIPAASIGSSGLTPLRLTFERTADTNAGDCVVFGVQLNVVRGYGD